VVPRRIAFGAKIGIFRRVKITLALLVVLSLGTSEAVACLGQHESQVRNEARALSGKFVRAERKGYTEVRIEREDGTVIKQFVNSKGLVFGVAWQGPRMPDLKPLLATYFGEFQQAIRERTHHTGAVAIRTAHLVVESMGHMRAFHGRIYIPSMLPANVTGESIR
jgi:hypothetical protein